MRKLIMFAVLLIMSQVTIAQEDFSDIFGDYDATFVIYDMNQDVMQVYNPQRANERFSPFSTFKVPHAAIALESGIAESDLFTIEYDADRYPFYDGMERFFTESLWSRDHSLRSSVQFSIVWYFREMAGLIGQDDMQTYVSQFGYGNENIDSWLGETLITDDHPFWLGGSLEISAIEQVLFLSAFYQGELGLSESTTDIVLDIITQYETEDYRFYGKTGTRAGDLGLAWYVGIIEQGEDTFVFAFNVAGSPAVRTQMLRAILVGQGYMPENSPLFQN